MYQVEEFDKDQLQQGSRVQIGGVFSNTEMGAARISGHGSRQDPWNSAPGRDW
jgi:hypothetical protein